MGSVTTTLGNGGGLGSGAADITGCTIINFSDPLMCNACNSESTLVNNACQCTFNYTQEAAIAQGSYFQLNFNNFLNFTGNIATDGSQFLCSDILNGNFGASASNEVIDAVNYLNCAVLLDQSADWANQL